MAFRKVTFWNVFRLIFVLFSLYIMGDVFFRWDGFKYYASFSEFLPSVALVSILWSIVAVITSILMWLSLKAFEWLYRRMGWKIDPENLLIFLCFFVLLGTAALVLKRFLFSAGLTAQLKLVVLSGVIFAASLLTWVLRGKFNIIQERITPLVWLFGIIVILSVPLVAYHTWVKDVDKVITQEVIRPSIALKNRPNIILLTFDALTARDMSVYGYHRETTPFIKKWAKNSSVFTNVQAESNLTTATTASLMTGQRLWTHRTYHQRSSIPKGSIENIALLMKNNGYYTMSYIENIAASPAGLGISESFYHNESLVLEEQHFLARLEASFYSLFYGKIKLYNWILLEDFHPTALFKKLFYYPVYYPLYRKFFTNKEKNVITILDNFISDIDNNNPHEPFFVWLHLMPPHYPFLPPESFKGVFDSSPDFRTFNEQWLIVNENTEHLQRHGYFARVDSESLETLRARYDEYILYCDEEFEDFINQLIKRNKINNTVIILSSDHGESFEHNYFTHGGPFLYEQVTHIPLVIKEPGQNTGQAVSDLVEQIDIAATILDISDTPLPSWMEGRSLLPLMRGKELSPKPAFSMYFEKNPSRGHRIAEGTVAVWDDNYKLIHHLKENRSLLFNLKQDPDEVDNLIDREPEIGRQLLDIIRDNLNNANERIRNGKGTSPTY